MKNLWQQFLLTITNLFYFCYFHLGVLDNTANNYYYQLLYYRHYPALLFNHCNILPVIQQLYLTREDPYLYMLASYRMLDPEIQITLLQQSNDSINRVIMGRLAFNPNLSIEAADLIANMDNVEYLMRCPNVSPNLFRMLITKYPEELSFISATYPEIIAGLPPVLQDIINKYKLLY